MLQKQQFATQVWHTKLATLDIDGVNNALNHMIMYKSLHDSNTNTDASVHSFHSYAHTWMPRCAHSMIFTRLPCIYLHTIYINTHNITNSSTTCTYYTYPYAHSCILMYDMCTQLHHARSQLITMYCISLQYKCIIT